MRPFDLSRDLQPLSPEPAASASDALPTDPSPLAAASPADASALAPFAEDIEIDETLAQPPAKRREPTGRDMLINVVEGEEVRIAVVRRGLLEELYMERSSTESHIGNIYKGRVTNVEPSIQAAFIDLGVGKNGFLHISDLHPQYFPKKHQPRIPQQRRQQPRPPRNAPVAPVSAPNGGEFPSEADRPGQTGAPVGAPETTSAADNPQDTGTQSMHAAAQDSPAVAFDTVPATASPLPPGETTTDLPAVSEPENFGTAGQANDNTNDATSASSESETEAPDAPQAAARDEVPGHAHAAGAGQPGDGTVTAVAEQAVSAS